MGQMWDVAVIGGGAAGAAAAATLARCRRSVVLLDAGRPRNASADGVHNFLTREGTPPAELVALGRAEVAGYGGHVIEGRVVGVDGGVDDFTISLAEAAAPDDVRARRIVVTTGAADALPDIPGVAQRWGVDVLHCPFCHGWEVRDQRIAVIATTPAAVHQAHMFRQMSPHVTVLTNESVQPSAQQRVELDARGIEVVDGPVAQVVVADDRITAVALADGRQVACDAVVVASVVGPVDDLAASLGVRLTDAMLGDVRMGAAIAVDAMGATDVPGVWAAGNAAEVTATVIGSAAAGVRVAMAVNGDLVAADVAAAVAAPAPI